MEPHKYGQFLSWKKGTELAVTQPSLGCWSTKAGNIYRTSFKGFFSLVLLFPLTRITVLLSSTVLLRHYPAAAHPAGKHCLFLMVLCRHTNPYQPRGMHPKRFMGICFLPPAGACSRADATELLALTKPRERCVHRSWAEKPYHSAQGSRVHRYFKINP